MMTSSFKLFRPFVERQFRNSVNEEVQRIQDIKKRHFLEGCLGEVLGVEGKEGDNFSAKSFTELGGDSMSAVQLAEKLRKMTSARVTPEMLLEEGMNMGKLVGWLEGSKKEGEKEIPLLERMEKDSILPMDIHPTKDQLSIYHTTTSTTTTLPNNLAGKHVFLTGVTGFVGAFLLVELLQSHNVAKVTCLVRQKNHNNSTDLLTTLLLPHLTSLLLDQKWIKNNGQRMTTLIIGDLSRAKFGVSDEKFAELGKEVDVIIHCGAKVNHVMSYLDLSSANVGGTLEILRLACFEKLKFVTFISTVSVFSDSYGARREREMRRGGGERGGEGRKRWVVKEGEGGREELKFLEEEGGYSQTKWVGEQLVLEGLKRGIPGYFLLVAVVEIIEFSFFKIDVFYFFFFFFKKRWNCSTWFNHLVFTIRSIQQK